MKQRYQSNSPPKTPWQIFCRHMHYRDIKIHRSYKKEIRAGIKQFHQDYSAVEAWLQDVDNFE